MGPDLRLVACRLHCQQQQRDMGADLRRGPFLHAVWYAHKYLHKRAQVDEHHEEMIRRLRLLSSIEPYDPDSDPYDPDSEEIECVD